MKFSISKSGDEWLLIVHRDNGFGSWQCIGALNGEDEAKRVCRSLNAALEDDLEHDRWCDYFELKERAPAKKGKGGK